MFKIYTQANTDLAALASKRFTGFTITPAVGYWKAQPEQSDVIEIETQDASAVDALAADIKQTNKQETVLVTEIEDKPKFV